jgi:IMP cyclohydrolase
MNLFSIIDDQIILRNASGVYKQAKLATRGNELFAALSSTSFIMVYGNHETSSPHWRWTSMDNEVAYTVGKFGRLTTSPLKVVAA